MSRAASGSAASGSAVWEQPQPQRGAGNSNPDLVTMNVGAKTFETTCSKRVERNLIEVAQTIKEQERAVTALCRPPSRPLSFPEREGSGKER